MGAFQLGAAVPAAPDIGVCRPVSPRKGHWLDLATGPAITADMRLVGLVGASLLSLVRTAAGQSSAPAHAADHEVALNWVAPESCPDSQTILERVEGLVGQAVRASPTALFSIEARVSRDDGPAWTLHMSFRGGENPTSRTVTAATCDELADAAALFVALAIDPNLPVAGRPASSESGDGRGAAAAASATTPVVPLSPGAEARAARGPQPEPAPRPPLRVHVGALESIWFQRLPGVAPGLVLFTGLSRYRWRVSAELGFYPEQHADAPNGRTGGDLWLASAELNLAYALTQSRVQLAPYFGLELEWIHGAGTGQLRRDQGSTALVAFNTGARLEYSVSRRWALLARAKGSAPFSRPSFYTGDTEVFRPSWLGIEIGLGAAVSF
jgi:hypothetical protein